jgi:hypothetical protein
MSHLVGKYIKDNDPRMRNRILTIRSIHSDYVCAVDRVGREFRILVRRIHVDGKARRSGFSVVSP